MATSKRYFSIKEVLFRSLFAPVGKISQWRKKLWLHWKGGLLKKPIPDSLYKTGRRHHRYFSVVTCALSDEAGRHLLARRTALKSLLVPSRRLRMYLYLWYSIGNDRARSYFSISLSRYQFVFAKFKIMRYFITTKRKISTTPLC